MISVSDARTYTGSTSSSASTSTSSSTSSSSKTNDEFMGLLLAQLTNQNPLEPMDDTEMVSQMVSMNSLTELQKISAAISALSQTNQFVSATALMDKTVTYLNSDQKEVTGIVSGITMADSDVYLTVDDEKVALSSIVSVGTQTD